MHTKTGKFFNLFVMLSMVLGMMTTPVLAATSNGTQAQPEAIQLKQAQSGLLKAAAQEAPISPSCALLDDPAKRGLMSGMFESALLRACGRTSELPNGEAAGESSLAPAGTDVLVNDPTTDTTASTTQSETSIAINANTGTVCSAFNDSGQYTSLFTFTGFSRSTNGGTTFTDQGPVGGTPGAGAFGDPGLVWRQADGAFYLTTLSDAGGLSLYKSADDCQTFTFVTNPSNTGNDDKELIAVDNTLSSPYYGNMYIAWTDFTDGRITVKTSSNGGTTWSSAVKVSSPGVAVQGAWPTVAPNGDVYVAWVRWNPYPSGPIDIEVVRSTNGGTSFTPVTNPMTGKVNPYDNTATANCGRPALKGDIRYLPSPQIVVGPDGALHVIYTYDPDGNGVGDVVNVYYRKSMDNGATWGPELMLNDDGTTTDQWFPTLSVGPSNVVVATWYDRRLDAANNTLFDYYTAVSYDGGTSFGANTRVSDVSSPVAVNFDPLIAFCYHGDYDTQVQDSAFNYIQWSDDRNIQNGHNDPDIWFDKAPVLTEIGTLTGVVLDAGTSAPIAGAQIFADGTYDFYGYTAADGTYSMIVGAGTYDVTASAFGYLPDTVNGVVVVDGGTTTQNFSLTAAPSAEVSGVVYDVNTGWPLYARIDIAGVPGGPFWTDPTTGEYAVTLPTGATYNFSVAAWVPGYLPASVAVPVVGPTTQDFPLDVNAATCVAPGYSYSVSDLYLEDFEGGYANWTTSGLWNPESQTDTCGSQVAPFPSPTNAAYYGIDGVCTFDTGSTTTGNLTQVNPVALPAGSAIWLKASSWSQTECGGTCPYDKRYFDVSTDGVSFTNVGEVNFEYTWGEQTFDISQYAGQNVYLRFRFDSLDPIGNSYFGWMLDNVKLQTAACLPSPGGLVVGNVFDENTASALNGADVWNDGGYSTVSQATPEDPNVDDGFFTVFSPPSAGGANHYATKSGGYGVDQRTLPVPNGDTVGQDFFLPAGWINGDPTSLSATLDFGQTETQQITLTNLGALAATFEIKEKDGGFIPARRISIPASDGKFLRGEAAPSFGAAPGEKSEVSVSSPIVLPSGTLVYSVEAANSYFTEFDLDVPEVLPNLGPYATLSFPGAGEYVGGYVYVVDGTVMKQLDVTGAVVNTIPVTPPSGSQSYTGMAIDPTDGMMYVASCDISTSYLYTIDLASGTITPIGQITGSPCTIAIAVDGDGNMWSHDIVLDSFLSIDKATGAGTVIGSLGFDANYGQGMGWDQATDNIYLVAFNNATFQAELRIADRTTGNTSLVGVLGQTTPGGITQLPFLAAPIDIGADVPWLSESPITGTLSGNFTPVLEYKAGDTSVGSAAAAQEVVGAEAPVSSEVSSAPSQPYAPTAVLYDNGPLVTIPGGGFGGADLSGLQTALLMNTLGFGHQFLVGNRVADDFTVTDPSGWLIDKITFYAYQTGSTTASTMTGVYLQIWDGPPNDPGSSVVWGDLTTNRLVNTTWSGIYRATDAAPLGNTRPIMADTAKLGVALPPGTYWLDWMTDGVLASGPWAPPVTILGQTTTGNALQWTGTWGPANDTGTLTQQDFPFIVEGSPYDPQMVVDVTFDAGVPEVGQPGEYLATLNITNDTPYGKLSVPVTMIVNAPDDWGKLEGTVTSLGYCDVNPAPAEGAIVVIEDSTGVNYTLETDAAGYFTQWFDEAKSPFAITVTYPEHETGTATGVVVTGGQTTTQDFDLRWLKPCMSVDPGSFSVEVGQGFSVQRSMELSNAGAAASDFKISEKEGTFVPAAGGTIQWLKRSKYGTEMIVNRPGIRPVTQLAYPKALRWTPVAPSAMNVLVYADDYIHFAPFTYIDQALQYLGVPYTAHYDGDFGGFENDLLTGGPWDLVIFANENYGPPISLDAELSNYVLGGGKLVFGTWQMWNFSNVLSTLGVTYLSDDNDPPNSVYWWEPGHPVFNDPESVPEYTSLDGFIYGIYGQYVDPLGDSLALGGYTTPGPDPGQAAFIINSDATGIFKGFVDGTNSADLDGDTMADPLELWINMISGIDVGFNMDVPWLSEDPITGTVSADSAFPVVVTFTAAPTMSLGTYTALMKIKTGDPMTSTLVVPVTMVVSAPAYGVDAVLENDALSGMPGQVVTYTLMVTNASNGPVDSFDIEVSGNDWVTSAPASVGPLAENETAMVEITVEVPAGASLGGSDVASCTVTSQGDPAKSATVTMTTTVAEFFRVELAPASAAQGGTPGSMVMYELTLTNTGTAEDTIDLSATGAWVVSFPVSSFTLAAGESVQVVVYVAIPAGAAIGDSDVATVTATSQGDPTATASSELTTTATMAKMYLPVIPQGYMAP